MQEPAPKCLLRLKVPTSAAALACRSCPGKAGTYVSLAGAGVRVRMSVYGVSASSVLVLNSANLCIRCLDRGRGDGRTVLYNSQ